MVADRRTDVTRRGFLVGLGAGGAAFAALYTADRPIQQAVLTLRGPALDAVDDSISWFGNIRVMLPVAAASWIGARLLRLDGPARLFLDWLAGLVATAAIVGALKYGTGRWGPGPGLDVGPSDVWQGPHANPKRTSFPSAHAAVAFANATALGRLRPDSRVFQGFLYGFAGLVTLSRVYNGAHWASDSVAGAVIGHQAVAGASLIPWPDRIAPRPRTD